MGRSRRHTPIRGVTSSESEKIDKRHYNRRYRRATSQVIQQLGPDVEFLPQLREYSDPWSMSKDGKLWFDPARYTRGMRK